MTGATEAVKLEKKTYTPEDERLEPENTGPAKRKII